MSTGLIRTYPTEFMDELRAGIQRPLRVVASLGFICLLTFAWVDPWLLSPGMPLAPLIWARAIACALLALIFVLTFFPAFSRRYARALSLATCFVIGVCVIAVTVLTGGAESRYHEALFIVMFAFALLPFPWQPWHTAVAFGVLLVLYNVALAVWEVDGPFGILITNNALLTACWGVATMMQAVGTRGRFDEFTHRAELAATNSRLKELDRAKSRFFANLSHELRTPLTLTLAPVESILSDERQPPPPGHRQKLELIQRNAVRLLRLVDDLLALSRAEATTLRLAVSDVSIERMAESLRSEVAELLARKAVAMNLEVHGEPTTLRCDPDLVERVFLNLLGNAAKFTPEGGSITIAVHFRGPAGVEVAVTDSGIGIPPESLPYIFDRFFQVDDGSTRAAGGTGIGLALAREIVELHGGTVEAVSEPGAGTTIRFTLPADPPASAPRERRRHQRVAGTERRTELGLPEWHAALKTASAYRLQEIDQATERRVAPRLIDRARVPTILIVEDNPDLVHFLAALLAADFNTMTAPNGREGLRLAADKRPDLIISDVMMPEMDGFEMVRHLRADAATSQVPVILLTARGADADRVVGRAGGADAYLSKPFSAAELLAAVDSLLRRQDHVREAAREDRDEALVFMASGLSEALGSVIDQVGGAIELLAAASPLPNGAGEASARAALTRLRTIASELRHFADLGDAARSGEVSVRAVVVRAVEKVKVTAGGAAIELDLRSDAVVPVPRELLEELLEQLVLKAVEATDPDGRVTVRAWDESPDRAHITVHDQGPGLPAQHVERVFYPYYSTRSLEAPRMGLALGRRLIELHGGRLEVEPGERGGSTFVVRLPVVGRSPATQRWSA